MKKTPISPKTLLAIILTVATLFTFTACSEDSDGSTASSDTASGSTSGVVDTSGMEDTSEVGDTSDDNTSEVVDTSDDNTSEEDPTPVAADFAWDLTDDTLTISGHGRMPDYISDSDVPWYTKRDSIKKVIISDSITSIGDYAFYWFRNLATIDIHNSITSIGNSAFEDCDSLTTVTIPNSVTSIGNNAFFFCSGLTTITIPDSVVSIGDSAFYDSGISMNPSNWMDGALYINNWLIDVDDRAESFTLRDDTRLIADGAFTGEESTRLSLINTNNNPYYVSVDGVLFSKDRTKLISYPSKKTGSSFTIPDSVTSIGNYAFNSCYGLTAVTIPNSVTSIGDYAFNFCGITTITIPDSVTSIGDYAFNFCSDIATITIPDSVTSIGDSAFRSCTSLTTVTIPVSVTSIGDRAFYKCINLTAVTIPDSVTSIGDEAFYSCDNLTDITYKGTKSQWEAISKGEDWDNETGDYTVHCTDGDI